MPSSATPLAFIGDEIGSASSRKITSWCGISAWKVVVDEEAGALVDDQLLGEGRADIVIAPISWLTGALLTLA
jgi:hypothetical protein